MAIEYRDTQQFEIDQLADLFDSIKWESARYPDKLRSALAQSHRVFSAWDGQRLVGLINALSDNVMTVYFHYLLVHPAYQKIGIGRTLVKMMLDAYADYYKKVLIADGPAQNFYRRCGFTPACTATPMYLITE